MGKSYWTLCCKVYLPGRHFFKIKCRRREPSFFCGKGRRGGRGCCEAAEPEGIRAWNGGDVRKVGERKGSWREKRRGFFRKGLRGTVPHRPPSQAWVRRCAARQGRRWRISRTRLASASLNPPQAALGSAPTADPHNLLMGKSGPGKSGSERKAKWPGQQGHKPRTSELFLPLPAGWKAKSRFVHQIQSFTARTAYSPYSRKPSGSA